MEVGGNTVLRVNGVGALCFSTLFLALLREQLSSFFHTLGVWKKVFVLSWSLGFETGTRTMLPGKWAADQANSPFQAPTRESYCNFKWRKLLEKRWYELVWCQSQLTNLCENGNGIVVCWSCFVAVCLLLKGWSKFFQFSASDNNDAPRYGIMLFFDKHISFSRPKKIGRKMIPSFHRTLAAAPITRAAFISYPLKMEKARERYQLDKLCKLSRQWISMGKNMRESQKQLHVIVMNVFFLASSSSFFLRS